MFFIDDRQHFFKPLTSKYREQVVQCLCLLYQRQYSSTADYGHSLNREQLIEILEEALALAPELDVADDEAEPEQEKDTEQRFKTLREKANWILKQLIECGWIERQVDPATLQSTFPFSRMGRVFSLALMESDSTQIRTRHRNTRNTLNSLEAFISRGEVYDLLDAYEYSERIITDFTDVISELEERKRELVREVESQQLVQQATDQFFEFMEKRFQPDISVRLSADSVEKHRDQISKAIAKIRKKDKAFKQGIERELQRTVPDLYQSGQSVLWLILDTIENRMRNAAEIMLPALRRSLHGFTKRADIIIRQLTYLNSQQNNNLLDVCRELSELDNGEYDQRMTTAANELATIKLHLIDPTQIRLAERQQKQSVDNAIARHQALDIDAHRELMIQQLLDQAFVINNQSLKDYVMGSLREGRKMSTRDLPINDAKDLLAMAHVIEAGAVSSLSSELQFVVIPTGCKVTHSPYYHEYDEFIIEIQKNS